MFRIGLFGSLAFVSLLQALPSIGRVDQGEVSLFATSDMLEVNAKGKAILHWDQFDIASHETVRFFQSQENQAILNRVMQGSASQVLGSIQANCPIYLINPSGVFIGSNASVNTAGFFASTADLSNESFWEGSEWLFQGFGEGNIINLGAIKASQGDVMLIARKVDNQGKIEAPNGMAVLATCEMKLLPNTKQSVFIRVDETVEEEGVQNRGTIQALAVELRTSSPYEKAIHHTGVIEALATLEQKGRIFLVAEKGGTVVNGDLKAEAGEIRVLGQTVSLDERTSIDASGTTGGIILIGGDYQGINCDILNAEKTHVAPGAQMHADALLNGNGGKVIIWSDETTSYGGTITACGGMLGGDGGLVEVSGKQLLFNGKVITDAPLGEIGTLLLDPTDITIAAADSGGSFSGCIAGTNTFTPDAAATDTIAAATLVGLLDAPCNVVISTVGSAGAGTGAIIVSSAVSWTAPTTLTLTAASFITISAAISNNSATPGFTALSMTANGVGATTNPGILLSAGTITTDRGHVILNGTASATATASHGVSFNGGAIATGSGNIAVTGTVPVSATGGSVHGINMNTANGITSTSGNITLSGTTNTSGASGFGVQSAQSWTTGTTGLLTFSNCSGGTGTTGHGVNLGAALTGSGDVTFSNCIGSTGGGNGINVTAAFTTAGTVTATSSITGRGVAGVGFAASASFSTTGAAHPISITASATGTTGACHGISLTGGSMSTNSGDSITLNGTGGASSTASHGINLTGGASTVSTTTGSGNISLTGAASGSGAGIGVRISGSAAGVVNSTSGTITISGTSSATAASSHAVSVAAAWTPATTGLITFSGTSSTGATSHGVNLGAAFTGSGDVTFSNCIGSTGGGNGINVTAAFTTTGTITATSSIIGRGVAGRGFSTIANFSTTGATHPISITASATGTTGACHGISLSGATISTNSGDSITLNGTGGTSSGVSHGITVSGNISTITGNGPIFATGTASGTAGNIGINIQGGSFNSTSGNITLTGTTTASGVASTGIFVSAFGWNALTTGLLTFTNCTGGNNANTSHGFINVSTVASGGPVIFSNCSGGPGGGHGVLIPATFTVTGNLTFLNCTGTGTGAGVRLSQPVGTPINVTFSNCVGGTNGGHGFHSSGSGDINASGDITTILPFQGNGNGGIGLLVENNAFFRTLGAGKNISVVANATGTTGACHGISVTGGALTQIRTLGGGNITLTGTAGPSSTASHGINISSGVIEASTTGAGTVTCTGTGGAGTGGGYGVFLTGATSFIRSVDGLISVTGNGSGTGVNAGGIGIFSNAIITPTGIGGITLNGTASATGGNSSQGIVINGTGSAATTSSGNIVANGTGGGTGTDSCGLEISSQGKINSTSGSISGTCVGGAGSSGCAGILVTGAGSQITTASGTNITLTGTGGGTTTSNEGISLTAGGSITTTNNVTSTPVTLTGIGSAAGTGSNEGIFMTGAGTQVSTLNGNIQMTGTAGGGTTDGILVDTSAIILTATSGLATLNSPNGALTIQNNSSVQTTGVGGPGINDISVTAASLSILAGASGSALLSTANGDVTVNSTGDVILTGGAALGPNALIQCTIQGAINLSAQNLNVQGGSAAGQSGLFTQSGDIDVLCTQNCQYQASTPGALAIMQTLGSDLTVTTGGAISLAGFTIYSTPNPGNLLLIAGTDINIDLNAQVIANGTAASSSLTLVVDNAFPTSPLVGPGQFNFNGTLTTGTPGIVPLRIYTARRTQNTITNLTINSMVYVAGTFAVDTPTEMWGLYYPAGAYGGMAFTIYYKEPQAIPPPPPIPPPLPTPTPYYNGALSLEELTMLLPVWNNTAIPFRFPPYHFSVCVKEHRRLDCNPIFSPYGSFIFEDDVYWIGENPTVPIPNEPKFN